MDDDQRAAFRRALGVTLKSVRRKLTPYRSQASIADLLNVNADTVGRWERGEREPKVSELVLLWKRYDVPAEWLLEPTDSLSELDDRVEALRHERRLRAALEAARGDEGEGPVRGGDGVATAPRGRRSG